MAKPQRAFVCQSCGTAHPRWAGRCDECGAWNSLTEETAASPAPAAGGKARGRSLELTMLVLGAVLALWGWRAVYAVVGA